MKRLPIVYFDYEGIRSLLGGSWVAMRNVSPGSKDSDSEQVPPHTDKEQVKALLTHHLRFG